MKAVLFAVQYLFAKGRQEIPILHLNIWPGYTLFKHFRARPYRRGRYHLYSSVNHYNNFKTKKLLTCSHLRRDSDGQTDIYEEGEVKRCWLIRGDGAVEMERRARRFIRDAFCFDLFHLT